MPCSALCRPSVDCLHNLNEAGNSFQELHTKKEMFEFISLIQVVFCAEILCWPLLESINCFSFDLCVCSEFACLFLVLLSWVTFGTNLYLLI